MPKSKPMWTIFLIVFISLFGFGIILPLLPFIAEKYNATAFQIGALASVYSLAQFIAAPILGQLSDRFGRKKLLIVSQIGSAAGFVLLAFANTLPLIFLSRLIDGITGGNISIAQAYIADITTKKDRAAGMGILGAAFGLGFILGPTVGGLLSSYGFWAPALLAAAISLTAAVAVKLFLKETVNTKEAVKNPQTKTSLSQIIGALKTKPLSYFLITFFMLSLAFSLFQGIFALWASKTYNYGPKENGYLFTFIGLLAVIIQLKVLPITVKKMGERKTLITAIPLLAFGLLFMGLIKQVWALYFGLTLMALGNGLGGPTLQSLASENVDPDDYGETLGMLQSAGSVGRIFGPAIGGKMFSILGRDSPFLVASVFLLLIGYYLRNVLKNDHHTSLSKS